MGRPSDIGRRVKAAQGNARKADDLVRDYLPFIKAETAKFLSRPPVEGRDDELSIALFAFHEAITSYDGKRGAFIPFAARSIRNRLIDFTRREARHAHTVSLDQPLDEEGGTLGDSIGTEAAELHDLGDREATRQEIVSYAAALSEYGIAFADVAESCPKQERTLDACRRVLACARENPVLLDKLEASKKLPMAALSKKSGVDRKTLERHRRYLVALLVAYTNGFEIIRGHLRAVAVPGGRSAQ